MRRVGLLAVGYLALGCSPDPERLGPAVRVSARRARAYVEGGGLQQRSPAPAPSASVVSNPGRAVFADAGTFRKCYVGFAASGDPVRDVMRLGLLCGPVNGMRLGLDVVGTAAGSEGHVVDVKAGDCFRVMAAAGDRFGSISVEVIASDQRVIARAAGKSWLVIDTDHPFCSSEAGSYRVVVALPARSDADAAGAETNAPAYALQIWRLRL
jgi:hypothetical protein